jgi:indole-3-glycerol phosphate synthase
VTTAAPDLLATIVAATRRIVDVRETAKPARALAAEQSRTPDGAAFERALRANGLAGGPRVIAECKRRSPSKGILRAEYEPAAHARAYAKAGAAAISVLTEPTFFDGSPDHLREVRAAVTLPILRKDFIVTEYQLLEAAAIGADAVLLIVGALNQQDLSALIRAAQGHSLAVLVEVHDLDELQRALDAGARIIGVNSRNLRTLSVDFDVFAHISAELPSELTTVAESGIRTREDIERLNSIGYDAFLVGERLIAQADPGAALRELVGP